MRKNLRSNTTRGISILLLLAILLFNREATAQGSAATIPDRPVGTGTNEAATQSYLSKTMETDLQGTVLDEDGSPLPGASVLVKETSVGTITDANGAFKITAPDDATTLVVSFVGFETKEVSINNQTNFTITLTTDLNALSEVVVVGYGTLSKTKLSGSIAQVSSKQLEDFPVLSPETAIAGQVAGVQVQEISGEPGASPQIRVRGSGSISAGNDPLFVIDGIPISRNLTSSTVSGGVARRRNTFQPPPLNPLATLNPNDIESIEVLKDASSAAIYGSRGGNGVVIITTKKGTDKSKGRFSFNSFYSTQTVANPLDLMNAEELIDFARDARNNNYLSSVEGASISDPIGPGDRGNANYELPESFINWDGTDTDWQDAIFTTGSIQNYNLSYASPTSSNTSFFVSGGYFSQEGIVPETSFDRYSLLMNLKTKVGDKLTFDVNLAPTVTENQRLPTSAPYFARPPGIIYSGIVHSPTVAPFNPDGTINQLNNQSYLGSGFTSASNPLAIIEAVENRIVQVQNRASIGISYEILPDLTFKTFGGTYINIFNQDFYRGNSLLYRTQTEGEPFGQSSSATQINWLWENTLNWVREDGDHYLNAIAGYTAQRDEFSQREVFANNYPDDLVKTVSGGQVFGGNSIQEEWSLVSALLRVNYTFRDKYLFTGTIRSDRSSRFGQDNQTGVFPSFSVGWRMNEEPFLQGISALSELKLKLSMGQTGNFQIPNYGAIGLLVPNNYNFNGQEVNGLQQSTLSNPNLTWEKASQINLGLEVGLFDDRVFLLTDLYQTNTTDLLLNVSISSVSGFETALQNLGEVENRGLEVALRTVNFDGDFRWETEFNFSANQNEVISLNEDNEPIFSSGSAGIRHVTRVGDPIGSYYGYVVDGVYQDQGDIDSSPVDTQAPNAAPGDFKFRDVDGDGQITPDDRTVTGSYFPDFIWGITNRFTYRGFDFSFLFQGVEGNEVLNLTSRHMKNGEANFNSYAIFNERWRSPSEPGNGEVPRADRQTGNHGNNNRPSSFQVEDGSFFRLRNISLGYTLPKTGVIGDTFDRLRVYVAGNNVFTTTDYLGYNPEVSNITNSSLTPGEDYGTYPLTRTFTVGLNLTF